MMLGKINLKQRLNQREKIIFGIATVIFCFGFIKACAVPSHRVLVKLHVQEAEIQHEIATTQADIARLQQRGLLPPSEITNVVVWMLNKEQIEPAITSFTKSAAALGVDLVRSQFLPTVTEESVTKKPLSLLVNGPFERVGAFIEALENHEAAMVLEKVVIETDVSQLGMVNAKIEGAYYAKK